MSICSFNEFMQTREAQQTSTPSNNVAFFSLKNDGDTALVRFLVNSTDDIQVAKVHSITLDGKYRKVECLRDGNSDIATCPLCAKGERPSSKVYVRLVKYTQDNEGKIIYQPCVWERPIGFGQELVNKLNTYGKLSDIVFKVCRNGVAGSQSTTYSLDPADARAPFNSAIYNETNYPMDFSAFDRYSIKGHAFMSKDFNAMSTFVSTGAFPQVNPTSQAPQQSTQSVGNTYARPTFTPNVAPSYPAGNTTPIQNAPQQEEQPKTQPRTYTYY